MGLKNFFDISQSSIGYSLQNESLKLNLIKLILLIFITHTGGTPTPIITHFFDILSVLHVNIT